MEVSSKHMLCGTTWPHCHECIILEFSENELLLCSENVPFARRGWLWVQRDRVPPYTGREIMEYLNKNYQ